MEVVFYGLEFLSNECCKIYNINRFKSIGDVANIADFVYNSSVANTTRKTQRGSATHAPIIYMWKTRLTARFPP